MKTGIQISSLKPLLLNEEQLRHAFAKTRALGCQTVQLQWIDPSVSVEAVSRALAENGLESVSVQDIYEAVFQNFPYYADLNTATGGKWLCVSRIPERFKSQEGIVKFAAELRAMQRKLNLLGQRLCFHPVSADFAAIPGGNAVDALLEAMPELALCLDLYHLNRCCGDLPGYIRHHAGRVCMVHFKDSLGDALVPAGQGDTDWTGVVAACLETGIAYGFVEQERWQRDPYECLKKAMDWLESEIASCGAPGYV